MQDDIGKLILRLTVGGLMLFHGVHKLLTGIDAIGQLLSMHGLPPVIAYAVYLGEVAGPVLILLGVFSRIGGLLIAVDMLAAILLAGLGYIAALNPATGGYALELELLYLLGGVAVALLGAGRYSLAGATGRWN